MYQKGHKSWNKGQKMSDQMRKKLSESRKGVKHSEESKIKNSLSHIGKTHNLETRKILSEKVRARISTGWTASKTAWNRIENEAKILEQEGFRIIPITSVIPDIIAIKDGKVYAVEVEYQRPNYEKYNGKFRDYYDDVIWIVKGILGPVRKSLKVDSSLTGGRDATSK